MVSTKLRDDYAETLVEILNRGCILYTTKVTNERAGVKQKGNGGVSYYWVTEIVIFPKNKEEEQAIKELIAYFGG